MGWDTQERRARKFKQQSGRCHWCKGQMTLERGKAGRPVRNYATFEHLQRKRDGGAGKHFNVVLACYGCNHGRETGIQTSLPKPENIAAKQMKKRELLEGLRAGTLTEAARDELFTRGLLPNWPMWSKLMAHVPLGNP